MKKKKIELKKVIRKAVAGSIVRRRKSEKGSIIQQRIERPIIIQQGSGKKPEEDKKKEEEKKKQEGVSLSDVSTSTVQTYREDDQDLTKTNIKYALIPKNSKTPYAWANIKWSMADSSLVYNVFEPQLNPKDEELLKRIKKELIEKLDVDFTTLKKGEARDYLVEKFKEMVQLMAKGIPAEIQNNLLYYIERDFIGLDKLEPIMQDPNIEDVSCDGIGIPIYIYHRNPLVGSIKTNIMFNTGEELDVFVNKLSQRCGKSISVASPLLQGALPDGSRVQATLGTDIARRGSNITIRKFTKEPLTPTHLLNFGTLDKKLTSYLWILIEYGRSLLVSGGTASGKTSMLNAISLFINPNLKIVSIEDTPELSLPLPHWIPHVARTSISEAGRKKIGEVDLFDLLKESLRQRPDYLIVGEVRGKEAYVLFQQIATGHPSMATIHADTMPRLIDRLTTAPISLPANLIESLDVIVFLVRIKYKNKYVRKISAVYEIVGYDRKLDIPITNQVFSWDASTNKYKTVNPSIVFKRISKQYGIDENILKSELSRREKILDWITERNIDNYKDFAKIVRLYYTRPEDLLGSI